MGISKKHQKQNKNVRRKENLKNLHKNLVKMAMNRNKANVRLPPEVNRVLYVRNLPYKITAEEMYDIFGKYGAIRQIRVGNTPDTRGTAFVVYEDIFDAKNACDHLSGFNVCNRWVVVLEKMIIFVFIISKLVRYL